MSSKTLLERWLKHSAIDAVKATRSRMLAEDDADEGGDDEEDKDSSGKKHEKKPEKKKDDVDVSDDMADAKTDPRGGPQQADAARRQVPAPDASDLSLELVVDKLNAIRSGKSLKDKGVRQRIGEYFTDLNSAQRLALFAFLEGLAEIIALEVSGDDARTPGDPDIGVDMTQTASEKQVEAEPNQTRVVKGSSNATSDAKRVVKGGGQQSVSSDRPNITRDAGDGSPVLVVRR